MTAFIGDVPAEAAALAEASVYELGTEFFTWWEPREFTVKPYAQALDFARGAHVRDGRARCVVPTSAGYVVYPLRRAKRSS